MTMGVLLFKIPDDQIEHWKQKTSELESKGVDFKDQHTIDTLIVYQDILRPMLEEYNENKCSSDLLVAMLKACSAKLKVIVDLRKYAFDRHKVDLSDEPYASAFLYNRDATVDKLFEMYTKEKVSYEDMYKHVLRESTRYNITYNQKPN